MLKKVVDFLVAKKNVLTNVIGFIFALAVVLKDQLANTTDTFTILQAVGVFIIAWFTGKTEK